MAGRKENLKALFTNTRSRVIIIFTAIILITAIVVGMTKFLSSGSRGALSSDVSQAPSIQSIPGALNPTAQYADLQEKQNETQAKSALNTGNSAIPTIIRSQSVGQGVGTIGVNDGTSGVGFSTLLRDEDQGTQRGLWIQELKAAACASTTVKKVVAKGAELSDLKAACSCIQLKDLQYSLNQLEPICSCQELKKAGFNARQLKDVGYSAQKLRLCGFSACELRVAGFTAQQMKDGGFSNDELKGAGFAANEIESASGVPNGMSASDIRKSDCSKKALSQWKASGVSASAVRRIKGCTASQLQTAGYTDQNLKNAGFLNSEIFPNSMLKNACDINVLKKARASGETALSLRKVSGCSAEALKEAGYSAADLKNAGFTAAELKKAGFNAAELKKAGFNARELKDAGFTAGELKQAGFTPGQLKNAGFTAAELKKAGFTAAELKKAGFTAAELKKAGFTAPELKNAGFTAAELKNAGFTAAELKNAGFTAAELKNAGFTAAELKNAGFTAAELKNAGFTAAQLKNAGFTAAQLKQAGFNSAELAQAGYTTEVAPLSALQTAQNLSSLPSYNDRYKKNDAQSQADRNAERLQQILAKQAQQMSDQKYQQKIQQRSSEMLSSATMSMQSWKKISTQAYISGSANTKKNGESNQLSGVSGQNGQRVRDNNVPTNNNTAKALVKAGDVIFAVIDTSVNSDEPGPILATVISGRFKGAKLIGSFSLPQNAQKMIISFNTMSVAGAKSSTSIGAVAIDANTARTALSSSTDNHTLYRYGNLFASSFLEGMGGAFQSANTSVTVGGTGGGDNFTIANGVDRSVLQNTVIALGDVGKAWGQVAQQNFNTPATVQVYSGTGIGVLFTKDLNKL